MTMDRFKELEDGFLAAGQIAIDDIAAAASDGVSLIVNNRPDGEEPGQPTGSAIKAAAEAAGLAYVAIPIGPAGVSGDDLNALDAARAEHPGKTLAYCRSGGRSTIVWALSAARAGQSVDTIIEAAANAGYDIAGHRPLLKSLQQG